MKSGYVSIIGRPSCGKSTLLNYLCGHKISIVSPVPQTTRNRVRGILTEKRGQLVFMDTPGFHHSERKFNIYMKDLVQKALNDTDIVLYVADLSKRLGQEEKDLLKILSSYSKKTVIALNKADIGGEQAEHHGIFFNDALPNVTRHTISAVTGQNIDNLLSSLFELSPEGEIMYPEDFYTDQPPEFRISEIIREKAFLTTKEEVPHSLYVDIADLEANDENQTLWIRAFIYVERESQKGILVGKGGSKIKEIRVSAQKEIGRLFPYRIHLDLRIKVQPKWRKKDPVLKKLIT